MIHIKTPLDDHQINQLQAGDAVLITGTIYTARDAAHAKMIGLMNRGEKLPFDMNEAIIYYVGPTPARPGNVIGSAGPTTSARMDAFAPELMEIGLKGMIGKGLRDEAVIESIVRNHAVYFAAIGGGAALIANCIKAAKVIAFEELGTEAVRALEVVDFPAIVAIDSQGRNYYEIGREAYLMQM